VGFEDLTQGRIDRSTFNIFDMFKVIFAGLFWGFEVESRSRRRK